MKLFLTASDRTPGDVLVTRSCPSYQKYQLSPTVETSESGAPGSLLNHVSEWRKRNYIVFRWCEEEGRKCGSRLAPVSGDS